MAQLFWSATLAIITILVACQGQDRNVRVRLRGGRNEFEGRVEIYYRGIWGAVCDDEWDNRDGDVVCRMLGFIKARKISCCSNYGNSASMRILLDDVQCTGSESSLFQCRSRTLMEHNCDPNRESAGVVCQSRTRPSLLKSRTLRLVGGPGPGEGRVEIFHDDEWGSICDDGWSLNNGHVVCSVLGFDQAVSVYRNGKYGVSSKMWLDDVRCKGIEQSLEQCRKREWGKHNCNLQETAGVKCSTTEGKTGLLFRLNGSPNPHEGRVEVLHNGVWGAVCDDYWKLSAGNVVCRYLGYDRAIEVSRDSKYRASRGGHMFLDDVDCKGNEDWLFDCKHRRFGQHNCNRYKETAGVVCDKSSYRTLPPLACPVGYQPEESGLNCTDINECGNELNDCKYECVNTIGSYKCVCPKEHTGDGVICKRVIKVTRPGAEKIRLRDGSSPAEGRVEVWNQGTWGTICDDYWDLRDGNVVCRVLGYLRAKNVACCNSFRGINTLDMMLDNVGCKGMESSLFSCKHNGWGIHDCDRGSEEAGVTCTNEPLPTIKPFEPENIEFRLVGGATPHEGRVEMFYRNTWGAICDDQWKLTNGHVICRYLGYRRANSVSCCSKYNYARSGIIWLDNVQCSGREKTLVSCRHRGLGVNNCNKGEHAGVECYSGDATLPPTSIPTTTPAPPVTVRIAGGPSPHEGRVEFLINGVWGAVCDKGWQLRDGDVLCRTLGFYRALSISCCSAYGASTSERIWLSDVRCRGYERTIDRCGTRRRESYDCGPTNLAGVKCLVDIPTTTPLPTAPTTVLVGFRVRIVGGKSPYEGSVNVFYNGVWGAVCDDQFGIREGHVVCRMLGFGRALSTSCCSKYPAQPFDVSSIIMDDVQCKGTESSLSQCKHAPWDQHNCNFKEIAGVVCQSKLPTTPSAPPKLISYGPPEKVRLAGSSYTNAGRVEIFYQGQWGAVCDDNWELRDGHVVCSMLGFDRAKRVSIKGRYGRSRSNRIWLDEINCRGTEKSLFDCRHRPFGQHDCKSEETAGVECLGEGRPRVTIAAPTTQIVTVLPTTPAIKCGQRKSVNAKQRFRFLSSRKKPSQPGDWPWQAAIMNSRKFLFCAGALISDQWVLSVAHCFDRIFKDAELFVRLGAHRRVPASRTWLQDIPIDKIFKHPFYNRPIRYANDIVLLKLARPATLNKRVNPVCLTKNTRLFREGAKCWTSGWGLLLNFRYRARILQRLSVPLRPLSYCKNYRRRVVHKSMLCAGYSMRWADSCSGDSGGPLVCENKGSWYLQGLTSWGGECKRTSLYGLYANVPSVMDWAYKIMKKN